MPKAGVNLMDLPGIREVLNNLKEKNIALLEPSLSSSEGITYKDLEEYSSDEQKELLDVMEQKGLVTREMFDSILKCPYDSSYRFSVKFVCTLCMSTNIMRGTVIEHSICGNIDFDEKYANSDGSLVCKKCNKRLKAIGVDYSKPGYFYKCNSCKAMLPTIGQQYTCLECGKSWTIDQLQMLSLFAYRVNMPKVTEALNEQKNNYLLPVIDALNKIGIKSTSPGKLTGKSKTEHFFELIVYDKNECPIILVDTSKAGLSREPDDMKVLAFYAKCIDIDNLNKNGVQKILIVVPALKEDAKTLASAYGISIIEVASKKEAVPDIVQAIIRTYTETAATEG